ncbi:hypothetical protein K438DRAFT_503874 [Mycena galopus ATCC 62051]|nr:hypothetical protein K438DRAFT_503874 [Mycena galopus ATCC 62051]
MMEVQELVDLTIDFLHDSRADLKRCSTVNKSWLPSAQYHLFSHYVLQNEHDCQRLFEVLQASSHIRRLVTHLALSFDLRDNDAYYTALAAIPLELPNLRKLSIYRFPSDSGLAVVQRLCALPSITHIFMLRKEDPARQSSLLMLRTAHLGILEISSRYSNEDKSIGTLAPNPRCTVDCIDIHDDQPQALVSLIRALDLSGLKRLIFRNCGFSNRLNPLLRICTSVSDLDIHGAIAHTASFGRQLHVGPTSLPHLTYFAFHILAPSALIEVPLFLSQFARRALCSN